MGGDGQRAPAGKGVDPYPPAPFQTFIEAYVNVVDPLARKYFIEGGRREEREFHLPAGLHGAHPAVSAAR